MHNSASTAPKPPNNFARKPSRPNHAIAMLPPLVVWCRVGVAAAPHAAASALASVSLGLERSACVGRVPYVSDGSFLQWARNGITIAAGDVRACTRNASERRRGARYSKREESKGRGRERRIQPPCLLSHLDAAPKGGCNRPARRPGAALSRPRDRPQRRRGADRRERAAAGRGLAAAALAGRPRNRTLRCDGADRAAARHGAGVAGGATLHRAVRGAARPDRAPCVLRRAAARLAGGAQGPAVRGWGLGFRDSRPRSPRARSHLLGPRAVTARRSSPATRSSAGRPVRRPPGP